MKIGRDFWHLMVYCVAVDEIGILNIVIQISLLSQILFSSHHITIQFQFIFASDSWTFIKNCTIFVFHPIHSFISSNWELKKHTKMDNGLPFLVWSVCLSVRLWTKWMTMCHGMAWCVRSHVNIWDCVREEKLYKWPFGCNDPLQFDLL